MMIAEGRRICQGHLETGALPIELRPYRCAMMIAEQEGFVKVIPSAVAYPLLRVEIEKIEVERAGDLPPGLLRPASIEPLDL